MKNWGISVVKEQTPINCRVVGDYRQISSFELFVRKHMRFLNTVYFYTNATLPLLKVGYIAFILTNGDHGRIRGLWMVDDTRGRHLIAPS